MYKAVLAAAFTAAIILGCGTSHGPSPDAGDGGSTDTGIADGGSKKLTSYVDPFIGTGGLGFGVGSMTPAATVPLGMVKVGPDTQLETGQASFYHCAGYYYDDNMIQGFSHVHMPGIGVPGMGNLTFMPVDSMDRMKPYSPWYAAFFDKKDEHASAGYYSVTFKDSGIFAELTATARAAAHRYTWPAGSDRIVLIDLGHALPGGSVKDARVDIDRSGKIVTGTLKAVGGVSGRCGGSVIYFHARFNTAISSTGTWNRQTFRDGSTSEQGDLIGAYLGFGKSDAGAVEAQVGISYISVDNAKLNLEAEMPVWDFNGTKAAADAAWEKELSTIRVEGGTETEKRMFYTALYHVLQTPYIFTDVDNRYVGLDKKVHTADGFMYYTGFSMWDTYRTQHPLLTLLFPDRQLDMIKSMIKMYEEGGAFPRWPVDDCEAGCMVGDCADIIIADSYVKGLKAFDAEKALEGMLLTADGPLPPGHSYGGRDGIEDYLKLHFLPADRDDGSVSVTQEYTYDDFAIAQLAGALGKGDLQARFMERSKYYTNLFNPDHKYFIGRRSDMTWIDGFFPTGWADYYVEGDAWQYRFFVPYDIPGLAELFGGNAGLQAALDDLFAKSYEEQKTRKESLLYPDYYWQGNEPDIHTAYIYNEIGRPDLTAEWARWIVRTQYGDTNRGLPGNDDCGTMSAWLMFSMMGFYPVPARDVYMIGSPVFSKVELNLPGGRLVIEAPGASKAAKYVQSATLGGKALDRAWFKHADIVSGGTLTLPMGETASQWGRF